MSISFLRFLKSSWKWKNRPLWSFSEHLPDTTRLGLPVRSAAPESDAVKLGRPNRQSRRRVVSGYGHPFGFLGHAIHGA